MPDATAPVPPARPAPSGPGQWRVVPPRERSSRTLAVIDVRTWPAKHRTTFDLVVAGLAVAGPLIFEAVDAGEVGSTLGFVDVAIGGVAFALIALRRRAPLTVLAVALVAAVWSLVPSDDQPALRVAVFAALYTVGSTCARGVAWAAGAVSGAALFVAAAVTSPGRWYDGDNLEMIAWAGAATAVGDAVRSRRAYVVAREERAAALEERALRAEQALDEEARRQVVEERLRIARELHDVVAHHIAVINVQAGLASHVLREDPAAAEDALAHVRRGAKNVLQELGVILSVMRRADDPTSVDPLPTLDQLDGLLADLAAAGLDVDRRTSGAPRPIAPAAGLAAYRIVQESLTNARRHGCSRRADLTLSYGADHLDIEVLNDAEPARPVTDGRRGHGLVGMRERAPAAGGTIDVGPTGDGRFRVHLTLPLDEDER